MNTELIEKYRYINVEDDYWYDDAEREFRDEMESIGVKVGQIFYDDQNTFFEGSVSNWGLFLRSLGYGRPALITLAENAGWHFETDEQYGYEAEMVTPDSIGDDRLIELYSPYDDIDDVRNKAWLKVLKNIDYDELEKDIAEAFKEYTRDLRRKFEELYNYLVSDEAVWETLVLNGLVEEQKEEQK